MSRWRKRPVEVDAIQWTGGNEEAIAAFVGEVNASSAQVGFKTWNQPGFAVIRSTVDDNFAARLWNSAQGDWESVLPTWYVVKGITGHFFTLTAEQFADICEPAGDLEAT